MKPIRRVIGTTTSTFDVARNPALTKLKSSGYSIFTNPYSRKLTATEVKDFLQQIRPIGIIAGTELLPRDVLEENPQLQVISRCGAGLDSVDLEAAKALGITVCSTPDAPTTAVAELAIALMLSLLRDIPKADRSVRQREFKKSMGRLLRDCTVGIIGYGRIGKEVTRICKAFGAKVLVTDVHRPLDICETEVVCLHELLGSSDIVSLHVPLNPETRNLIDGSALNKMKRDAFILNLSRGGIVDEHALLQALRQGQIAGAALDVFEHEPYDGPLREENNVLLTPHIGSYTHETRARMELEAAENLVQEFAQKELL